MMGNSHLTVQLSLYSGKQHGHKIFQYFSLAMLLYCRRTGHSQETSCPFTHVNSRFLSLKVLKKNRNVPFLYVSADGAHLLSNFQRYIFDF